MVSKKYKTQKDSKTGLLRIIALKDFSDVKNGDEGGLIEKEENLSQEGNCWVYCNAQVCGNARVYDNAQVCGFAQVYGEASISGDAVVYYKAKVFGSAQVFGNARVCDNAQVYGKARIFGNSEINGAMNIIDIAISSKYVDLSKVDKYCKDMLSVRKLYGKNLEDDLTY